MFLHNTSTLFQVLTALIVILFTTRAGGAIFKKTGQPEVMGEILGGIFLGPSILGWLSPQLSAILLPEAIAPQLNIIAQIGIVFYMFLLGLEIDLNEMKKSMHSTMVISSISILFPFLLGFALSSFLLEINSSGPENLTSFSLFMGVSLSVTAFPVLARILTDQNLQKTKLGSLALACAAVNDVIAWCLLAFVLSFASSRISQSVFTILSTIVLIFVSLRFIRPYLQRKLAGINAASEKIFLFMMAGVLLSALITEAIGIHALFGAFLFGALFPHDHAITKNIQFRLNDFIRIFFLPVFFAFTGMRTKINLVSSSREWLLCAVIIVVAILGKFGGTFIAAKMSGYRAKKSAALGVLMNTRGLVELIVLNIGLDIGVISPLLYTMLVIMALATTLMTGPLLKLFPGEDHWEN